MVQCSNTNKVESTNNSGQIDQMLVLEKKILSIQNNVKKKNEKLMLGEELYSSATQFILNNPNHEQIESVYVLAARGAEISEKYDNAINYYFQAQRKFPESSKAAEYLKSRAIILDFILKRKKQAILAHEELIDLYPNHPLAIDSKEYLERNLTDLPDTISSQELEKILENKD
jgi:tetratricopeptide (TPR) repeat protein